MTNQDNFLIIPEFILLNAIEKGLAFVRSDFQTHFSNETEEESYLYELLGGANIQRYNYFKQGKKVILAEEDDPRKINIDLIYNMDVSKVPSVYVGLGSEQNSNGQNGIGLDQGYIEDVIYEDDTARSSFTRRKNSNYTIMITSDNSNEVVMLYHFLYALILSLTPHLNMVGLHNVAVGGQDLQLRADLLPKHLFTRALSIGFQYEVSTPDIHKHPLISSINFSTKNE